MWGTYKLAMLPSVPCYSSLDFEALSWNSSPCISMTRNNVHVAYLAVGFTVHEAFMDD